MQKKKKKKEIFPPPIPLSPEGLKLRVPLKEG